LAYYSKDVKTYERITDNGHIYFKCVLCYVVAKIEFNRIDFG